MAVFDLAQNVVNESSALITGDLALGDAAMMAHIQSLLEAMELGELILATSEKVNIE